MKKLLLIIATAFALSACHVDEHAAGEAIFKEKGSCSSHCKKSKCKESNSKCCHKTKKTEHSHAEHSHNEGACALRKTGKSRKSHDHGARACASHTHEGGHGHSH